MNLGNVSMESMNGIYALDMDYVGTYKYMGVASFWGHEYKHTMRNLSYAQRRRIHKYGLMRGTDFINPKKSTWHLIADLLKTDVNNLVNLEEVNDE